MKALWWFKDNSIAGMARPGFNALHWKHFAFDEGILLGWLGQYSSGSAPLESFRHHLEVYAPKVLPFFKLSREESLRVLKVFETPEGILSVAQRLIAHTQAFANIEVDTQHLHFSICANRLSHEADKLKELGIQRIVSLTERHHDTEILGEHFDLHHLGIEDMNAPQREQVFALSEILKKSEQDQEVVAVHCLAGIGRTSTMLIASHLAMGESIETLSAHLAQRNPTFQLIGAQAEFIRSFRRKL